jgi:hypothetical protein
VLTVVCFFVTISYLYRLVFALLTLPWLIELTRGPRREARIYGWLVLGLGLGLFWANGLFSLLIKLSLDLIPAPRLGPLLQGLIVAIHLLGWLWVLLLLTGLGTMARYIWHRWMPPPGLNPPSARPP